MRAQMLGHKLRNTSRVFLMSAGVTFALQASILPAGTAQRVKEPVTYTLHRAYKEGQQDRYKITIVYLTADDGLGLRAILKETTGRVLPDGSAEVVGELLQGELTSSQGKGHLSELATSVGFQVIRDNRGRISQGKTAYALTDKTKEKPQEQGSSNIPLQILSFLTPDKPVRVGETWTVEFGAPKTDNLQALPVLTTRLLSVQKSKHSASCKVQMSTDVTWDKDTWHYEGTGVVDMETGRFVRLKASLNKFTGKVKAPFIKELTLDLQQVNK